MRIAPFVSVAALAVSLQVATAQTTPAQPQPGTVPVTSQTPVTPNGATSVPGTTTEGTAVAPTTKSERKAQHKEQKRAEKSASANAKAAKANAKAVKAQDKATDAAEKTQQPQ